MRPVRLFPVQLSSMLTRGSSSASLHNSTIRSTIYQLMLHSLDPLGEGKQGLPDLRGLPVHSFPSELDRTGACEVQRQWSEGGRGWVARAGRRGSLTQRTLRS